jgi:hypothetical protein
MKRRKLAHETHFTEWPTDEGKRTPPAFAYELNGQRYTLKAPPAVIEAARTVYARITGETA